MANYDQSGNPVGNNRSQGQQGSRPNGQGSSGQWHNAQGAQGRDAVQSGAQHAQYSGNQQVQNQGRSTQRAFGGSTSPWSGGLSPELYGAFGGGPFQLISRLSDEMDRLFESFGMGQSLPRTAGHQGAVQTGQTSSGGRNVWSPHIEVVEREGKLLVQADLPGVRKEDVNVQVEDGALIIQGHRQQQNERNGQGFYHSERSYGAFYRVIPLPEGTDGEQANATFRDGVLHIEVQLPQQRQRGRRLEIRDASPQDETSSTASQWTQGGAQSGQQHAQGTSGAQQSGMTSGTQQGDVSSERR